MRYYSLEIRDPASGQNFLLEPRGLGFIKGAGPLATSLYTTAGTQLISAAPGPQLAGKTNLGALNIEFDLPVAPAHTLQAETGGSARLWGVGIHALAASADLNPQPDASGALQFKTFLLRGGMAAGMPLANASQQGILATGIVYQAFGNWTGVDQALDLILRTGIATPGTPISGVWTRGTPLTAALPVIFNQAFPGYAQDIKIGQLVALSDQPFYHKSLTAFAANLLSYTKSIGSQIYGPGYSGVYILPSGGELISAIDSVGAAPRTFALNFQDLIGQPVWIENFRVTFQTTLRGDIGLFDHVTFPTAALPPYVLVTPQAAAPNTPASARSLFQGTWWVSEIHHFASFREPSASSWNTTYVVNLIPAKATL